MRPSGCQLPPVLAVILVSSMTTVGGDDWLGFRGLHNQGVGIARQGPTHWSMTRNMVWRTQVRGGGHSSPVVAGNRIFLTTAYEAEKTKRVLTAARRFRAGLAIATLVLWVIIPLRVYGWQHLLATGSVALFTFLAFADEQLLQLSRSPARAWLGAGLSLILGLFVSLYGLPGAAQGRRVLAAALGVTGVLLVTGMLCGLAQSRPLGLALGAIAGAAFVCSILGFRGLFQSATTNSRRDLRLLPVWRACVLAAAPLGLAIATVLVPRSEMAYAVVCIDREDGRVIWVREGLWGARTAVHRANSLATPTPVTDGERVIAYFGTPGLMAVDATGTLLWTNSHVPFRTIYGVGASPVLDRDTVVVSSFSEEGPYLVAFDAATGLERWRIRRVRVSGEYGDSRTPIVTPVNGRRTVISWGIDELAGYDVETGDVLWRYAHRANGRMGSMVASLVTDRGDMLYLPLENGMIALSLSALAASRDPEVWRSRGGASGLSTPVVYDGRIFAVSAAGVASCTDAKTGELLWRARLAGAHYSSPVALAGKIYFTNDSGTTTVVAARSTYQVLALNNILEPVSATMAAVDGNLYIRGHEHLHAIRP